MKSFRNHAQTTGIIALTLLCLSLAAAPASAMGSVEFDSEAALSVSSVRDQIADVFSSLHDTVTAFILDIGSIFAHQDGVGILD